MKRIITFILALMLLLSITACADRQSASDDKQSASNDKQSVSDDNQNTSDGKQDVSADNDAGTSENDEIKHTGKKVSGEITGASVFSEGLAFVCLDGNKEKTYCINKEGYIVFELDKKLVVNGEINAKFINGHALVDGGICDTKGKIIYPEDVGATEFYDIALEGGYIVAEKTTADYSSSRFELGVLNFDFEWVIQPSEEIYNIVKEDLRFITVLNTKSYYYKDFVYFEMCQKYLNLKTGEVSEIAEIELPSHMWQRYTDNTYRDYEENILLDLSEHKNVSLAYGSTFVNGKAPILFHNQEAKKYYFTVIDECGTFLFEPVEIINAANVGKFVFDGKNILITNSATSIDRIWSYNIDGEYLGCQEPKTLGYMSYSCVIFDSVILVKGGYNYSHKCYYFNTDLTPLFEMA